MQNCPIGKIFKKLPFNCECDSVTFVLCVCECKSNNCTVCPVNVRVTIVLCVCECKSNIVLCVCECKSNYCAMCL